MRNKFYKLITSIVILISMIFNTSVSADFVCTAADKKVTCAKFAGIMSDVIKTCDASLLPEWKKVAKKALKTSDDLHRGDA